MIADVAITADSAVQVRRFAEEIGCGNGKRVVELRLQRGVLQELEALWKGGEDLVDHGDVVRRQPNTGPLVVVELCIHIDVGCLIVLQLMSER